MAEREVQISILVREKAKAAVEATKRQLATLQGTAQTASGKISAAFKKAENAVKRVGSAVSKGIGIMKKYKFHILAVVAAIVLAVKSALEFQKSLSKVATLVAKTEQIFGVMAKQVKALSIQFGKSTAEITESLFDVISSTFRGKEAMEVLAASTRLATIGFSDVKTATSALITTVQNFTGEIKNASDASDFLFAVQQRGRLDLTDLASNFGKVASTAKAFGITLEDLGVIIAAISRAGIRTEEVMTETRALILSLSRATPKATEAAKKYGLIIDANLLSSGKLAKELTKLKGARIADMNAIFPEVEALRGYNDLVKEAGNLTTDYTTILDRATLSEEKMAEITKQAWFQMEQFKQRIADTWREIGNFFIPALSDMTKAMGDYFQEVNDGTLIEKNRERTMAAVLRMAGATKEEVKSLIEQYRKLNKLDIQLFTDEQIKKGQEVVAFVEGQAAAYEKLLEARRKANLEAREELESAFKLLKIKPDVQFVENAERAIKAFKLLAESGTVTGERLGEAWQNAKKQIEPAMNLISKKNEEFVKFWEKRFPDVTSSMNKTAKDIAKEQKKALEEVRKTIEGVINSIESKFSDVLFARLTQKTRDFKETMIDIFRDMGDSILRQITDMVTKAVFSINPLQNILGGAAQMFVSMGGTVAPQALAPSRVTQTTAGGLVSGATGVIQAAPSFFGGGTGGVSFTGIPSTGITPATNQAIQTAVQTAVQPAIQTTILSQLTAIAPLLAAALPALLDPSIGNIARLGFSALSRVIADPLSIIGQAGGLAGGIGGFLSTLVPLGDLGQGIGADIGGGVGSIGGAILGSAILPGIGTAIGAFGGGILGTITGGLFGGGGEDRGINLPALDIPESLARYEIPSAAIISSTYRDFGPEIVAQTQAIEDAIRDVMERFEAVGRGGGIGLTGITNEQLWDAIASIGFGGNLVATSPSDAGVRNQAALDLLIEADEIITKVEGLVEQISQTLADAIGRGFEEGFNVDRIDAFGEFEKQIFSGVVDSVRGGATAAILETTQFKDAIESVTNPLATFFAEQSMGETFDVTGFGDIVTAIIDEWGDGVGGVRDMFLGLFDEMERLNAALFPEDVIAEAAQRAQELTTSFRDNLEGAIATGLSAGFMASDQQEGFKAFEDTLKAGIFDNVTGALIESLKQTAVYQTLLDDIMAPMEDYLDAPGTEAAFGDMIAAMQAMIEDIDFEALGEGFGELDDLMDELNDALFPEDVIAEAAQRAEELTAGIRNSLEGAIATGLSAGFMASDQQEGYKIFEDTLKASIFDNVTSAITESIKQTTLYQGLIESVMSPIRDFLNAPEGGIVDTDTLRTTITNILAGTDFEALRNVFGTLFNELGRLNEAFFPEDVFAGAAQRAEDLAEIIKNNLTDSVAAGISAGFMEADFTTGFKTFEETVKQSMFNKITEGVITALSQTTIFKKVFEDILAPVEEFLAKEPPFNVAGLEALLASITGVGAMPELGQAQDIFRVVFRIMQELQDKLLPLPPAPAPVAQAVRIPRLQHGGEITRSGLAFVDRGETFSGVRNGISKHDLLGGENDGSIYLDLRGAHINLSSSQNIDQVARDLGEKVRLEIKRPRQFSGI